jgi:hypothetical protein
MTSAKARKRRAAVPARATGGYQVMLGETPRTHFWAGYYIGGYGWIPCDSTVAERADWLDTSEKNRERFKAYSACNLDPTRLVIRKDVDVEMDPAIPNAAVVFGLVRQYPAIISDTAEEDLDLLSGRYFTVTAEARTERPGKNRIFHFFKERRLRQESCNAPPGRTARSAPSSSGHGE